MVMLPNVNWTARRAGLALVMVFICQAALAQDPPPEGEPLDESAASLLEAEERLAEAGGETTARVEEAALNEDPEAQRRSQIEEAPGLRSLWPKWEFYGSVRLHVINHFDINDEISDTTLGDGASRLGLRGQLQLSERWWAFGRAEAGFDVLDTFTSKAGDETDDGSGMTGRLLYAGLDSDNLAAVYGKNWSAYYKIAGMADRFSIFGGNGVGVYNAGTDGGATGTGRADNVLQARIFTSSLKALRIKPFNLNVQYQSGRPIPHVEGAHYDSAFGASAWLESQGDHGIGLAYHRSSLDVEDSRIAAAGIDGDAQALAVAFRSYGERWYAALVLARLDNIETTEKFRYISGRGAELYVQWQFGERWWLIGGGNWLIPDDDDPDAGEYEVAYGVLGLRYTFDSFNRMLYAEYRFDDGYSSDGTPLKDELTVGVRWDFGH